MPRERFLMILALSVVGSLGALFSVWLLVVAISTIIRVVSYA